MTPAGFPHSDIFGSKPACGSPKLFAVDRVLLRLLAPRHPPYALIILTFFSFLLGLRNKASFDTSTFSLHLLLLYAVVKEQPPREVSGNQTANSASIDLECTHCVLLRKEVIQPHLPIRLPCYDFTPIIDPTLDGCLRLVRSPASGVTNFRGVTGGVCKTRERIHRDMLTRDY